MFSLRLRSYDYNHAILLITSNFANCIVFESFSLHKKETAGASFVSNLFAVMAICIYFIFVDGKFFISMRLQCQCQERWKCLL